MPDPAVRRGGNVALDRACADLLIALPDRHLRIGAYTAARLGHAFGVPAAFLLDPARARRLAGPTG